MQKSVLKIVAHYVVADGKRIEIDPALTDLPDRCKIALAEMFTGKKHEEVKVGS